MLSRDYQPSRLLAGDGSACGTAAGCGRDPNRPVVIASVSDVSSLDPHLLDVNHPTGSVIWSLFDSLVRRGPDGADLPRLAQRRCGKCVRNDACMALIDLLRG